MLLQSPQSEVLPLLSLPLLYLQLLLLLMLLELDLLQEFHGQSQQILQIQLQVTQSVSRNLMQVSQQSQEFVKYLPLLVLLLAHAMSS